MKHSENTNWTCFEAFWEILENLVLCSKIWFSAHRCRTVLNNTMKHSENTTLICFDSQQLTSNGEMSWTTYTVYIFADDLHWPGLGNLLESIDYHEAARKASFLGSMCEDTLMAANHFERRFDALMKYVINSQEHPIGKVKDFFYRVEFEIRGSCDYLVSTYFFWIENIPQDISCDTRDV